MRTIFKIIAALSALISLAFLGLALVTGGKAKTLDLGKDAEHTYALKFDGFDIVYDGRVTNFGPRGFSTKSDTTAGITIDHQTREADPRRNLTEAVGKKITIPALYPIALFAILPLLWIISKVGGKKKKSPAADAESTTSA
jgi:hypothetical protein